MKLGALKKTFSKLKENIKQAMESFEKKVLASMKQEDESDQEEPEEMLPKKRYRGSIPVLNSPPPKNDSEIQLVPKTPPDGERFDTTKICNLIKAKPVLSIVETPPKLDPMNGRSTVDYSIKEKNKETIFTLVGELKVASLRRATQLLCQYRVMLIDDFDERCIELLGDTQLCNEMEIVAKTRPELSKSIYKINIDLQELLKGAGQCTRNLRQGDLSTNSQYGAKGSFIDFNSAFRDAAHPGMKESVDVLKHFVDSTKNLELKNKVQQILTRYCSLN